MKKIKYLFFPLIAAFVALAAVSCQDDDPDRPDIVVSPDGETALPDGSEPVGFVFVPRTGPYYEREIEGSVAGGVNLNRLADGDYNVYAFAGYRKELYLRNLSDPNVPLLSLGEGYDPSAGMPALWYGSGSYDTEDYTTPVIDLRPVTGALAFSLSDPLGEVVEATAVVTNMHRSVNLATGEGAGSEVASAAVKLLPVMRADGSRSVSGSRYLLPTSGETLSVEVNVRYVSGERNFTHTFDTCLVAGADIELSMERSNTDIVTLNLSHAEPVADRAPDGTFVVFYNEETGKAVARFPLAELTGNDLTLPRGSYKAIAVSHFDPAVFDTLSMDGYGTARIALKQTETFSGELPELLVARIPAFSTREEGSVVEGTLGWAGSSLTVKASLPEEASSIRFVYTNMAGSLTLADGTASGAVRYELPLVRAGETRDFSAAAYVLGSAGTLAYDLEIGLSNGNTSRTSLSGTGILPGGSATELVLEELRIGDQNVATCIPVFSTLWGEDINQQQGISSLSAVRCAVSASDCPAVAAAVSADLYLGRNGAATVFRGLSVTQEEGVYTVTSPMVLEKGEWTVRLDLHDASGQVQSLVFSDLAHVTSNAIVTVVYRSNP